MYIGIYAVILIAGILLLKRKKRADLAKGDQSQVGYGMAGGLFAGLMIFGGILVLLMQLMTYHYYLFFTESRKQTVAAEMGMLDSADVRYTKFSLSFGGPDGTNRYLTLKCRTAPMTVLETCCRGNLLTFTADGIVYDAAALTDPNGNLHYDAPLPDAEDRDIYTRGTLQTFTDEDGCTGFYEYSYSGHRYWIFCYEDGSEWYRMKIRA